MSDTNGTQVRVAATAEEREELFRLRYAVYVEETRNSAAGDADHDRRRLTDPVDDVSRLLIATVDGELAGSLRLTLGADGPFPRELMDDYQLERFADLVDYERMVVVTRFFVGRRWRGSDVSIQLLSTLLSIGLENGFQLAFCDCMPHLLGLYTAMGWRSYAGAVNAEHDVMFPLVLVNDPAYLEAIGSPLLDWGLRGVPPLPNVDAILARVPQLPPARPLDVGSDAWAAEFDRLSVEVPDSDRILWGLYRDEVDRLLERSQVLELEPRAALIRRGHVSRNLYVILAGELEVHAGERPLRTCGEGEVVGDVAFLLGGTRVADVNAGVDGATVLSIGERAMHELIESQSRAAAVLLLNLARTCARRLAAMVPGDA